MHEKNTNSIAGDVFGLDLPSGLTDSESAWPTIHVDCSAVDPASDAWPEAAGRALGEALSRAFPETVAGQALLKVHVGEPSCRTHMKPGFTATCARFARERGASGVAAGDTTVAYTGARGHRQNPAGGAKAYLDLARDNGWSVDGPAGVAFVVLDRPATSAEGVFEFGVQRKLIHVGGISRFRDFHLAGGFAAAGLVVNNAHLTLHGLAGVAGCVKSIAMGCSSLAGKLRMHQSLLPSFDTKLCTACGVCVENCPEDALALKGDAATPSVSPDECIGCGECVAVCPQEAVKLEGEDITDWLRGEDSLPARMTDYALGLMHGKWEATVHVLHAYTVTKLCDCVDMEQSPMIKTNMGFIVGRNPFAVDKLAADMLADVAEREGVTVPQTAMASAERAARYANETYGILTSTPIEKTEIVA